MEQFKEVFSFGKQFLFQEYCVEVFSFTLKISSKNFVYLTKISNISDSPPSLLSGGVIITHMIILENRS